MINRFGPGVGHLNYLAVPGVLIFEFLFVPVTSNHFLGWGISVYLTSHFSPGVGNLTAIFGKMSKSHCMPHLPHPAGLTLIGALGPRGKGKGGSCCVGRGGMMVCVFFRGGTLTRAVHLPNK